MTLEGATRAIIWLSYSILTLSYLSAWYILEKGLSWGAAAPLQVHLSVAGIGVLLSLFANLCAIFYFVGTGVWMRDRAREWAPRDRALALRVWNLYESANKLKGKAFPFPTMSLVLGLFTFILGGAAQVSAVPHWVHPLIATLFVLVSWAGIPFLTRAMRRNLEFLDQVSAEIDAAPPIS